MRISRRVFVLILAAPLAFATLLAQQAPPATTPAPGTSAGTTIGNAIKTAITVAFPAVSSIINAIWPGNSAGNKTKPTAQAATAPLQQQSTAALQKIGAVSTDLDTTALFLSSCVIAQNNVVSMMTRLQGKTTISPADKLLLSHDWTIASGRLSKIASAGATINNISDDYIRVTLRGIVDANEGTTANIKSEIDAGTPGLSLLNQDLANLNSQLAAVNALAPEIIGSISLGLKDLKNATAGALGSTKPTQEQEENQKELDRILQNKFSKAKAKA
jgi:hypothetical protein